MKIAISPHIFKFRLDFRKNEFSAMPNRIFKTLWVGPLMFIWVRKTAKKTTWRRLHVNRSCN